jgi:hypothetical protein
MIFRFALLAIQWCSYLLLSRNLEEDWAYTGIGYSPPGLLTVVLAVTLLLVVASVMPTFVSRPSGIALWLLCSFVVTPTLAVSAANPQFSQTVRITAAVIVVGGFLVLALLVRGRVIPLRVTNRGYTSRSTFSFLVASLAITAIATIVLGYGIATFDLSFTNVYERRLVVRELSPPFPGAQYSTGWLKSVLVPLLVILGVQWSRRSLLLLASVGVLVIFAFNGEKAAFVFPVVAVVVLAALRWGRTGSRLPLFGSLITGILIVLPVIVGWVFPASRVDYLVTRRFGLTPGVLNQYYVEYASEFGYSNFDQIWARAPSIGSRVGDWLDPAGGLNANANLWADGYASGGFVGVAILIVLFALVLRFLDKLAASREVVAASAILGTACLTFVNGYFFTTLLTGGIVLVAVLVWLMPDPRFQEVLNGRQSGGNALSSATDRELTQG